MFRELSAEDAQRWFWYMDFEPFGAVQDNVHAAIVAHAVMEAAGAKKVETGERFTRDDFILKYRIQESSEEPKEEKPFRTQSVEFQVAIATAIVAAVNKSVLEEQGRAV